MNKDLTVGKPVRVLWKFCLPLFGSILFQQAYNIADSLVAGKFVGEEALAAVGNGYEITLIFLAFAFGCNIGCSVVVSRLFGSKQYRDLKTAVWTTFFASAAVCLFLMGFGLLFCRQLLGWIRTPENVVGDSELYLRIYIYGLPFVFFYNVATGIFSALGDSKTPFFFLAASSVANIGVDIAFVTLVRWGVAGVAWATFLCQGGSCVLALVVVMIKLGKIPCTEKAPLFSKRLLKNLAFVAVPSIFQQCFISFGNLAIQGIINPYGSSVMAGYSAAIKLNNLVITAVNTLANGVSNYVAQNIGAGKRERIRPGFRAAWGMVWILCVPIVLLYVAAANPLIGLFMESPTEEAMRTGVLFLRIVSPFYFFVSVKVVADGVLRGAGLMVRFMTTAFLDLALRVALAAVLSASFGSVGIWCAWPIGWAISTSLSLFFYARVRWEKPASEPQAAQT